MYILDEDGIIHIETRGKEAKTMPDTGIRFVVLKEIEALAKKHGVRRVILFGSRARGSHRKTSDIDLALSGGDQTRFALDVDEETSTLLQYDFVNLDGSVSSDLREAIQREGITLYEEV